MRKRIISLLAAIIALAGAFAFSISVIGADYSAYQASDCPVAGTIQKDNKYYYHNGKDNYVFFNGRWVGVDYMDVNGANVYSALSGDIREKMVEREPSYTFIIATDRAEYNQKGKDCQSQYYEFVMNQLYKYVYSTSAMTPQQKAVRGEYLRENVDDVYFGSSSFFNASGYSPYSYYMITFNFKYKTTAAEQRAIDGFMGKFQKEFIESNSVIANSANDNIRKYYIVKTIYNFLSENTKYDEKTLLGQTTGDRNRRSHSLYGALFGNINGSSYFDMTTQLDSQGLTRLKKYEQGLSVCDGYALFTYYICQLNGIDCSIIKGDYDASVGKSDPHAWNIIKLCSCEDVQYNVNNARWYYFDATYSATSKNSFMLGSSSGISATFVDYSYFLRGTSNPDFSISSHQKYSKASTVSSEDYCFKYAAIDISKSLVMVTRRVDESNLRKFESSYIINSKTGKTHYKFEGVDKGFVTSNEQYIYDGRYYYYFINIQDAVNGVEYSCNSKKLINSGNHSFPVKSMTGKTITTAAVPIYKLNMSNSKRGNYNKIEWNHIDITSTSDSTVQKVGFIGSTIQIVTDIVDCAGKKLERDKNYLVFCTDMDGKTVSPIEPGKYRVVIDFDSIENSNYYGKFVIRFNITRNKIGNVVKKDIVYHATFGEDVTPNYNRIYFKDSQIYLYKGTDFDVRLDNDINLDVGSEGSVTLIARDNSKYLVSGSSVVFKYKVDRKRDLSGFSGTFSKYSPNVYTGSPIKLESSQITLEGEKDFVKYNLKQGKDYTIKSYSDNVKVGIASAKIKFKGNFTGTATAYFRIYPDNANLTGGTTGNGDVIKPNDVIINGSINGQTIVPIGSEPRLTKIEGFTVKYDEKNDKAKLKWKSQGKYVLYEIYTYDKQREAWALLGSTNNSGFTSFYPVSDNKQGKFERNCSYKYRIRPYYITVKNNKQTVHYGKYAEATLYVPVKAPKLSSLSADKKSIGVKWSKVTSAAGYEIQYSTSEKFKASKVLKVKDGKKKSAEIKDLKSNKKYYVRVRAYSKIGKKTVYSSYSKVKAITVK